MTCQVWPRAASRLARQQASVAAPRCTTYTYVSRTRHVRAAQHVHVAVSGHTQHQPAGAVPWPLTPRVSSRATHGRHITPKQRQHGVTTPRTHVTHGFKEVITCACEAPCRHTCMPPLMRPARLCHVLLTLLLPSTGRGCHVHVHLAQHRARAGPTTCFKDGEPHACVTHGHAAGTRTAQTRRLHSPGVETVWPPRYSCSHATTKPS